MKRFFSLLALITFCFAASSQAQMLVLKDGSQLGTESFKVEGGKVFRLVKLGGDQNSVAQSLLPLNTIAKMEWPEPEEITVANDLLSKGKNAEAVEVLKKGKEFFEPFEKIEGSRFPELYLAYVDALSQSGNFDETIKAIPGLRILKLSSAQQLRLKIVQLNVERQTSGNPKAIVAQAENILSETDDSAVGASVWMIIGDVYFRAKNWEEALMAYLHVPVFFGTQVQKVPEAELASARCLKEMRRFEDARQYYQRIVDTYPGSGVATTATSESESIKGMKNEDPPKPAPAAASS
jgi:tetratricopeptide (TPR) repeat protein